MMSDDLVKRLREDQPVTQDMVSTMQCALQDAAASRIEQLEVKLATCKKYKVVYAEFDRIGTEAYRDLEAKLSKSEAKLKKAVEALVMIADGPSEMVWGVDSEVREKMREMESIAGLTLAELKGQDDE